MATALRRRRRNYTQTRNTETDQARRELARIFAKQVDERQLTQTQVGYEIQDAPSQVSLMVTGKLRGFSTERLLRTLVRFKNDIDIVVRPARGRKGRLRVVRQRQG